ncbi:AAA family ATPase (plasmid) [Rhizobium sullae]|uniref:AAA family ATPase n=1 Tax=Rhizobium sullae TaxID=50338 RepID=A0A2N0DEQ2_RHISU|nr:AAA family ATPase [Rhizobium sullae]PKA44568.1 hypothetical protein CWR43_01485 [Rhizobium sullae]UWU17922.1 AAA family ATPase [Rhizobium sullae]
MRLNRLDLSRYGKFTDSVIDFGGRPATSPDLHIIYGPNEAGKSTTLDAILDLIFGIGSSSRYGFLHPYATMRIGASIEVAGQDREFVRIKRQQNSLLDGEDRPLAEGLIKADLGGIDRDAFTTMFSLDDETLENGGEGILASKGDLGELLFSASAGLSELSRQLLSIRAEADGFYKYRARSGLLADLKSKLAALKAEREALDVQASDHERLIGERDRLSRLYDEVIAERAGTQRRIDEIRHILHAMPTMARLLSSRERLAALLEVPEPPENWRQELPGLRKAEIEHLVKRRDISRSKSLVDDEAAGIAPDPVALRLALRMDELAELKARYTTAQKDIPKITARAAELSIESILLRLGKPGEASPTRLVLDAATVGKLRGLIGAKSGVDARAAAAADELAKIERLLAEEHSSAPQIETISPDKVKAFEYLAATMKSVPRSDDVVALRSIARRRDGSASALSEALARLLPWRDTADRLAAMTCPSAGRLENWKVLFKRGEELLWTAHGELERLVAESKRLDAEIEVVRRQVGEVDEANAVLVRADRERAWAAHRERMDAGTADSFEAAMRADDHLASQRLAHFSEIGKLNQLLQRQASVRSEIETGRDRERRALADIEEVKSAISEQAQKFAPGVAFSLDPSELEDWLRRREEALKSRDELLSVEQELGDAEDRVSRAKRTLMEAMSRVGVPFHQDAEIASLVAKAEEALDAFHAAVSSAQQIHRLQKEYVERQDAAERAARASRIWKTEWEEVCGGCWLGELGAIPNTGSVTEILSTLENLASAIDAREGLIDRIQKMEKDKAHFEKEVLEICGLLSIVPDRSANDLAQEIAERVRDAGLNEERREKLYGDLDSLRVDERQLQLSEEMFDARLRVMLDYFGVTTLAEVESHMEIAKQRRELSNTILDLEHELLQTTGAPAISLIEELVAAADRQELENELARLTPVLEDQDARCRDVFHARSNAEDALDAIGGDSKVAEIEEQRRTLLLEIGESAKRYMELRAGVAAAEHGLKIYRDRHRSGMMARASAAFKTISRGAYQGVAAQPGKDGEVLIAVSAAGGSKAANELSKGARFQLYLALRVAGYHEFVGNRGPVPFIADDIMETFDDFRAEEAFKLFAEMAQHGQVIYLTHHRHLTDIARKVCPAVRLHDLDVIGAQRQFDVVAAE